MDPLEERAVRAAAELEERLAVRPERISSAMWPWVVERAREIASGSVLFGARAALLYVAGCERRPARAERARAEVERVLPVEEEFLPPRRGA